MTKHNYLSEAIRAFEVAAPRYCDFWFEHGSERECPLHDHDCSREGCGISWSTGGEVGVLLRDATGRVWLEAGVIVGGGIGI